MCAQNAPETRGDAANAVEGSSMLVSDCVSALKGISSYRAIAEAQPRDGLYSIGLLLLYEDSDAWERHGLCRRLERR